MNSSVEHRNIDRPTPWAAVIRLAVIVSTVAALFAIGISLIGDVSAAAIVIPVIVVGFTASWLLTGRVQGEHARVVR